jgi:hypothetical protein
MPGDLDAVPRRKEASDLAGNQLDAAAVRREVVGDEG